MSAWPSRRCLLALALLGGCALPPPMPPSTIIPGYEFALGANYNDIVGVIGSPTQEHFERYANLEEVYYLFPYPLFTVETRLSDGSVRSEVTDRLYLFFDSRGKLVQMTHQPNPYYVTLADIPVHRVKVAPRIKTPDGRVGPAAIAR